MRMGILFKTNVYPEVPFRKTRISVNAVAREQVDKRKKYLVRQVILYCADIELFRYALLLQSVITSVGFQQHYSEVTVMNKVDIEKNSGCLSNSLEKCTL